MLNHKRFSEVLLVNRRHIILLLYFVLSGGVGWAGEDALVDARKALLAGRYAEAVELFAPLAKERPEAAMGLSRCYSERGKDEKARKTLEAGGKHPPLLAELARLAFERGDYATAQTKADEALKLEPDQPLALWIRAETDRVAGRYNEAEQGYRRLVHYYNQNEVKDPEALCWIGQAAAQSARWNRQSNQFQFLVQELYPDALDRQPDFWPACYEMGLLFLEKHNPAQVLRSLQDAEKINPQSAAVHAALARAWLEQRDADRAEAELNRALEINPRLLDAWLVKADLAWANLDPAETLAIIEKNILPLNASDDAVLGRLAACYLLLDGCNPKHESSRFAKLQEKVLARNPRPGEFYFTLAAQLEQHNRQPLAEKYFHEARRVMPRLPGPTAQLGMMLMAMGRESEAKPLLDDAFASDPFDVRVHNSLNLWDVLGEMSQRETTHCRLRTAREDRVLADRAAEELEKMYPALCKQFGYTPPQKPPVDIFREMDGQSGHAWFSTRVSGLPFIGTVAASTGHLVAMVSPNEQGVSHRFNWVRVLRHELTHVITLQQTNFNIPHWYTEGLAVTSEGSPRPAEWNQLLIRRVPQGKIFNLQTLDSGFTRPHTSDNWNLAYCQAKLYVDYMRQLAGDASLRKMLDAYAEGLTTAQAIQRVFGKSEKDFERGYREFVEKETAGLRHLDWPEEQKLKALRKAAGKNPQDAEAAARLALYYLGRKAWTETEQWTAKAKKLDARQPLAVYVSARLLLKNGKTEQAVELLEKNLDPAHPQPSALDLLAELKFKAKDYAAATRWYELGQRLDAVNPQWTRALARVYRQSGETEKYEAAFRRLAEADVDDLESRLKLADRALKRKDLPAAEKWADEALQIDVENAEARRVLAEAGTKGHNGGK
jgi:cellulose synthase operon protein C